MTEKFCSDEGAVVGAVRSGAWTQSLKSHAAECAVCREVRKSADWMRALAREGQTRRGLPDARTLWVRAQLEERQAAAQRVQRLAQWIEIACVMAICAGLGTWVWREASGGLIGRAAWALFEGLYSYNPLDAPVLFSGAIMALTIIALALAYPLVWSREDRA